VWRISEHAFSINGCTDASSFLHGHHVHHWLHGGRTSLDNLLLLCSFHHRLVHEGGFTIAMSAEAQVIVRAPGGRSVSAETPDGTVVDWRVDDWNAARPAALAIPAWDGEPPDYDGAVDALWPADQAAA
jgi:hypothetical protein